VRDQRNDDGALAGPRHVIGMEKTPNRFENEPLTQAIIGSAIEVHRVLGPGLLESAYQDAMTYELTELGLAFEHEPLVAFQYKKLRIERGFRPDLIVERSVVVELKCVEKILPVHESQVRTYLKLTELTLGLIFNFNTDLLKSGIRRIERSVVSSAKEPDQERSSAASE